MFALLNQSPAVNAIDSKAFLRCAEVRRVSSPVMGPKTTLPHLHDRRREVRPLRLRSRKHDKFQARQLQGCDGATGGAGDGAGRQAQLIEATGAPAARLARVGGPKNWGAEKRGVRSSPATCSTRATFAKRFTRSRSSGRSPIWRAKKPNAVGIQL